MPRFFASKHGVSLQGPIHLPSGKRLQDEGRAALSDRLRVFPYGRWHAGLVISLIVLCFFPGAPGHAGDVLRLATTTSTENSGLLKVLLPPFERRTGIRVHVIAVGTGKALRLARSGDVDVVLVHARAAELQLVADGYAVNRREVMYNDFVLVGPETDPAGIRGLTDAGEAFSRISGRRAIFVSRGDDSGTHKKEMAVWQDTGVTPHGSWYRAAGQGMGRVLVMAGELAAYTLADRGTWLALRHRLPLALLVQGDPRLHNPYGIMAVNPDRFVKNRFSRSSKRQPKELQGTVRSSRVFHEIDNPAGYSDINYDGAQRLITWMTSVAGRDIIKNFTVDGQTLFFPLTESR